MFAITHSIPVGVSRGIEREHTLLNAMIAIEYSTTAGLSSSTERQNTLDLAFFRGRALTED